METEKSKISKFKRSRLAKFILGYKKPLLLVFFLELLSSVFLLVVPYFSKLFIDGAFLRKDLKEFLRLIILSCVIFLFSTLVSLVQSLMKNRISLKLKVSLANRFIRKIYSLDLYFFHSKSVGENIYRLSDSRVISEFILGHCPQFLTDVFKMVIILIIAFKMNPKLTLCLLVLSPIFLLHRIYIQKKVRAIYEQVWYFSAKLSKEIYEAFSRILIIKVLGLEAHQRRSYLNSLLKNIRWELKGFKWNILSSLSSSFLSKGIFGVVTLYGGWLIIKGDLSIGTYTAVMIYLTQLGGIIDSFGYRFEYLTKEMISMEKFLEVMESEPRIKDQPGAKIIDDFDGEVCFKDVCFGYEEDKAILKELNLAIPAASWVGIVGPSGCGKTTLVSLILRLYDPWRGQIIMGGVDLKTVKLSSLRQNINIATQQPFLFDLSIKENIAYGLKGISQVEVEEVSRIVCIDDFVNQLSLRYDTPIGEDAFRLSQGFKQRVAIARAVLRKPRLLILDEATASVDSFTEEKIFKNLRLARQGLTTLVISHRLFSIKDADRIYFLKQSGLTEEGRHEELLSKSRSYREFFHNQSFDANG